MWPVLYSGSFHWQWCARVFSGFWLRLVQRLHLTWRLVRLCAVGLMCHSQTYSFTFCLQLSLTMVRGWATLTHSRQYSALYKPILKQVLCLLTADSVTVAVLIVIQAIFTWSKWNLPNLLQQNWKSQTICSIAVSFGIYYHVEIWKFAIFFQHIEILVFCCITALPFIL